MALLTPLVSAVALAAVAVSPAETGSRIVVHDPRGDVRPSTVVDRSDVDVRRASFSIGSRHGVPVVRFVVSLPRRVPARDHLQGLVVLMHAGRHHYYVTGNQTPGSVVFADRAPGAHAYVERSRGTSRTFTEAGRLTVRVPVASFAGERLRLDRIFTHLGPLGVDRVAEDHVAAPETTLRLR